MTKYEEHVKRIVDAAEAGDFEEHIKIRSEIQYSVLVESYYKELRGTYFPSLCPELSGESDKQEIPDSLQKYTCNPETNPEFFIRFVPYDKEGVEEITDYYFISLFQVALLIGYRVDNDPRSIINDCPELFTDAIVNRLIDPRNPSTRIPYSKLHKSPRIIGEKIEFVREIPDLSWQLTLKEAAEFAILKGYPEHFFTDLLSDASTASVSQPSHEAQVGNDTFQPKDEIKLSEIERDNHEKSTNLRALNQAALKFWRNADRDDKLTWPKTEDVVKFLIKKGFSASLAKRGASIVRPDWAESGRIPSE